jgi:signal transduction histidine kinase
VGFVKWRWRASGWRADVLWAAATTALAVADASLDYPIDAGQRRVGLLMAVAGGLSMGLVRRWSFAALVAEAVVVLVTGRLSPFTVEVPLLLLLVALGMLAYRSGWPTTATGTAAVYVVMLLNVAATGSETVDWPRGVVSVVSLAGLTATPVAVGRYLDGVRRARRAAEERAAEAETRRSIESRAARLAERSRIARDLHDIVAHHISAMTLRASSGKLALDVAGDTALAGTALADVACTGRRVLDELRGLLAVLLDPDTIDAEAEPLVADPEAAVADAAERVRGGGVPVTVELDPRLAEASLLVRATVARVVQESLTNVLKHAGPGTATAVSVTVAATGAVRLRVGNERPSQEWWVRRVPALPTSGHGLTGIRQRVALLGGQLVAGPTPDRGWAVTVELPGKGDR